MGVENSGKMDPLGKSTGMYGGSIRSAGGTLGALEASRENEYFRRQDEQKLNDLREKMAASSSSGHHQDQNKDQSSKQD